MYVNRFYQTISGYGHDIALIKLSRPAILNKDVNLVCLPKQNNRVAIGKMCYLTGTLVTLSVIGFIEYLRYYVRSHWLIDEFK